MNINDSKYYNRYLPRILFPYIIPDVLVQEMNKLENLIPLTQSEHSKYEGKPKSFFDKYIRRDKKYENR